MKKALVTAVITLLCAVPLVQAQTASQEEMGQRMEQWHERMNTMYEQMDKINQTQDPEKRQQLLKEHFKTMNDQMQDMRMMGGNMMGRMHSRRGGRGGGMEGMHMMDPEQREQFMQDRMDMMQMMMEHMMNQQQMMPGGMHNPE